MKISRKLKIVAIATALFTSSIPLFPTKATVTGEEQMNQSQVIAVAVPAGRIGYNLAVVEQIPGKDKCWQELGSQPTVIDPLWTTFDFTGHCRRSTDSNGYSVRLDGQDTSLDYSLEVIPKGDELQLIARNRNDRSQTVVGKTFGQVDGKYLKIFLNPGWEFTKKTVEGKVLGHFFMSGDTAEIAAAGDNPPAPPKVATVSFSDTSRDIYREEIEGAVALGFIAGFKDNTFRPAQPLTREQLVSMVIGALDQVEGIEVQESTQAITQPYPDVVTSRWSATKIKWAKENNLVKGYPDGSFRPEQPVTRAELMAVLQNAAKYVKVTQGQAPELEVQAATTNFSDISSHWGNELIQTMSGFCNVASPYNESGTSFNPDSASGRNYAAAATLRMHNCIAGNSQQASQ